MPEEIPAVGDDHTCTPAASSAPFGRIQEHDVLEAAWEESATQPVVLYLTGPRGVGKTTLVKSFLSTLDGVRVVHSLARQFSPLTDTVTRHLFTELTANPPDGRAPAELVNDVAREGRLVWYVQDYDAWRPVDTWFRREIIDRLATPLLLILESHEPLLRLWAGDWSAQSRVRTLTVASWSDDVTRAYLKFRGLSPAWVDLAGVIASGSPTLAARIADAADADRMAVTASPERVCSFLLERALHPGSRRVTWRAGFSDDSPDGLIAAAAIVPHFTRPLMETMVGREAVERHWETITTLPLIHPQGPGLWGLAPAVRRLLLPLVAKLRCWSAVQWAYEATGVVAAARDWQHDVFHAEEILRDLLALRPALTDLPRPWQWGQLAWQWTGSTHSAVPSSLRVLDDDGRTIAEATGWFPLSPEYMDTVRVEEIWWDDAHPAAWSALVSALLARMLLNRAGRWRLPDDERNRFVSDQLTRQGLDVVDTSAGPVAQLEVDAGGLHEWIGRQWSCDPVMRLSAASSVSAVREALTLLNQPQKLASSEIVRYWRGLMPPSPGLIRQWVMDALMSADLGEWPSGRLLLTLYYIERRGSHESLAERLNLSRATYFRSHQRALQRLAQHLIGAIDSTADGQAAGNQ
jgi:hypothetical protein